jgi:hypothetical protein
MDIANAKSYATKENLYKAMKKHKIDEDRHLVVCNEQGRFTAIFFQSNLEQYGISYLGHYAQYGFMIVG